MCLQNHHDHIYQMHSSVQTPRCWIPPTVRQPRGWNQRLRESQFGMASPSGGPDGTTKFKNLFVLTTQPCDRSSRTTDGNLDAFLADLYVLMALEHSTSDVPLRYPLFG